MHDPTTLPLYDCSAADAVLDPDARAAVVDRLHEARTTLTNDADGSSASATFDPLDIDSILASGRLAGVLRQDRWHPA